MQSGGGSARSVLDVDDDGELSTEQRAKFEVLGIRGIVQGRILEWCGSPVYGTGPGPEYIWRQFVCVDLVGRVGPCSIGQNGTPSGLGSDRPRVVPVGDVLRIGLRGR